MGDPSRYGSASVTHLPRPYDQATTRARVGKVHSDPGFGHQHIGMHGDAELERQLPQVLQIARPVDVGEEARLPIIAPLHDVLGNTGKIQSGLAWHGRSFALRFGQRHPSAAPVRSGDDPSPGRKSAL